MEPFEFRHLKGAPLPHLRVHPCVRVEDVWMNRVQDARRPHRHVYEENRKQHDPEANAAEEVEDWSEQGRHSDLAVTECGRLQQLPQSYAVGRQLGGRDAHEIGGIACRLLRMMRTPTRNYP